ncbi:hypothetical protein [Streptomyces sp. NPDC093589]|uniref:hypothetical protein n=1 Tax=Streptomyces sp. NPDC093589 TaxID=3366043 RepID=UPI003809A0CC
MSVTAKATSQDARLEAAFGAPVPELYAQATSPGASPALVRALELRSFLAVAEEQVARVRDRIHQATSPSRGMGELSADQLRCDAQWMEAALAGRDGYVAALGELLKTMPPPAPQPRRPMRFTQPKATVSVPPAPAAAPAGAVRAHRP